MIRNLLPCPAPSKEICVREHDYSIRLIKIAGFPKKKKKSTANTSTQPTANGSDQYELTELFIEPIVTNVVKASDVSFCTNIPLEEICHTDDVLEITPIGDLTFEEELCSVSHLNGACKICLKNLTNSPDKILFFDEFGQITTAIANISTALKSMNVEVTNDDTIPKQMCIECYHTFSKMTLFKQICKRTKTALAQMSEFIVKNHSNTKVEDTDIAPDNKTEIEIKEEPTEPLELDDPIDHQALEMDYEIARNPLEDQNDQEIGKCFLCTRCGGNYSDQYSLVRHKRYDFCVDEINPVCRLCKKDLPTVKDLDHHLENSHDCYHCTKCPKTFNKYKNFKKHQQYHATLICDFCMQTFYSKKTMRQHLMSHVVALYPCPFCDQRFASRKRVGLHKKSVHPNELYRCAHCSKEFKNRDTYRVHILKHNPDKRYKCTYCPSQFVHRHHFENHTRTHTREAPFLCNFCGRAFRMECTLRGHLSTHDPIMYPPRYRYPQKKIKNCSLCDYSSIYGNLKKHMINVHGQGDKSSESRKLAYTCDICDKEFRQYTSLMNHLKIHDEVRDFHCTYCKASFRKAHYLRIHIDGVHLNKRPNKCDQCDAAYLMSNDLKRHKVQKHSKERPFQCYCCKKFFGLASSLKAHIKGVHRVHSIEEEMMWKIAL